MTTKRELKALQDKIDMLLSEKTKKEELHMYIWFVNLRSERRRNVKEEKKIVGEKEKVLKKTDPFLSVSIFTVVATTTAYELDGGGDNKTIVWLEDVGALVVTRLRWRRKKTIMTSRLS
ncbi:unnamed protein product [Brassica oleracea]